MKSIWMVALLLLGAMEPARAAAFSFGIPVRVTLERNSAANVAIGDANGDGRKDVVAISYSQSKASASLFLQRSDGSLAPPVKFALADAAFSNMFPVAFVDLNGDGKDEIVAGRYGPGITVLRLAATGALSAVDIPAPATCKFLTTGDLNGDGHMDVACHDLRSSITLFYGDGAGGIASTVGLLSPAGGYNMDDYKSLQIADVTGDGKADIVVTASGISSFFVYTNNGFGGFWPATIYAHPWSATGVWSASIRVLDLDGDGINEIVTASPDNQPGAKLNIYRRGADGYMALSTRIPIYDSTTALIAGDVDGDGHPDVVAGHYGFNAVTLLRWDAAGAVSQSRYELPGFGNPVFPAAGDSNALALGDLNGDGCQDLASAAYSGVFVLYGCRPAMKRLPHSDFDGDGVSDLLWRFPTAESALWQWGDINAWYGCPWPCPSPIGFDWEFQTAGDFDGDGTSDLFLRNRTTGGNKVWKAAFYSRDITAVTSEDWQVVGAGDFDGDDHSDLLWRDGRTGANTIWKSANPATLQAVTGVTDVAWKVVGVGDFDGDGWSDILWRHSTSGANVIWLNARSSTKQAMPAVNLDWQVAGIGDFNGDGTDDVVWHDGKTGASTIWLAAHPSTQQGVTRVTDLAWTIAAIGDYNGDGRADLMWRNSSTGVNVIWRSADGRQQQAVYTLPPSCLLFRQ